MLEARDPCACTTTRRRHAFASARLGPRPSRRLGATVGSVLTFVAKAGPSRRAQLWDMAHTLLPEVLVQLFVLARQSGLDRVACLAVSAERRAEEQVLR